MDSSLMLVKRDMVGLVKLVKGVYLLKLSCMDATGLVGLLASLRTKQPIRRQSDLTHPPGLLVNTVPSLTSREAGVCIP